MFSLVKKTIVIASLGFITSTAMAAGLECTSVAVPNPQPGQSRGDLTVTFKGNFPLKQYIQVDHNSIQVSWGDRPILINLAAYLNEPLETPDFVIFEPSDSVQNFNLTVKAASDGGMYYTLKRLVQGQPDRVMEAGVMICKSL